MIDLFEEYSKAVTELQNKEWKVTLEEVNFGRVERMFNILSAEKEVGEYDDLSKVTLLHDIILDMTEGSSDTNVLINLSQKKHLNFFYNFLEPEKADKFFEKLAEYGISLSEIRGIAKGDNIFTDVDVNTNKGKLHIDTLWERQGGDSPTLTVFDVYLNGEKIFEIDPKVSKEAKEYKEKQDELKKEIENTNVRSRKKLYDFDIEGGKISKYITKNGKIVYGYKTSKGFRFVGKDTELYKTAFKEDKFKF